MKARLPDNEAQRLKTLRGYDVLDTPSEQACGSGKFIHKLEKMTGRALQYRPRGRPRKDSDE